MWNQTYLKDARMNSRAKKVLLKKVNNDVSQCNSILIDIFQQNAT